MADKEYRIHTQDPVAQPARALADKRARWMALGCFLVVLFPLLYIARAWLPDGTDWKFWQTQRAEEVLINITESDQQTARTALIQAMKDTPNDPNVLRAWALYSKTYNGPAGDRIVALKKLSDSGNATSEDLVALATAHLDNQEFDQARRVLETVPETDRKTIAAAEATARLAKAAGDTTTSRQLARTAYEGDRENPESSLKLAIMQLAEPFQERRTEALASLNKLAELPSTVGAQAIEVLSHQPYLAAAEADRLLQLSKANEKVDSRQTYSVLSAVTRANPASKAALVQREAARASGLGLDDLYDLAGWLARENEYRALLTVVPQEKALSHSGLFKLFSDALIKTNSWQTLQSILDTQKRLPVSKGYAGMLRGLNDAQVGNTDAADATMETAIRQAISEQDGETILKISTWAGNVGSWDTAIAGYTWLAAADPRYTRLSLELLYEAAQGKRDGTAMLQAASRMIEERGAPAQSFQKLIYLKLVLGMEMETVTELQQRYPKVGGTPAQQATDHLLLALTKYRLGDVAGMKETLTSTEDWSLLSPGQRAVTAALLKVAGRQDPAIRLAQSVSQSLLLGEEKELIALTQLDDTLKR